MSSDDKDRTPITWRRAAGGRRRDLGSPSDSERRRSPSRSPSARRMAGSRSPAPQQNGQHTVDDQDRRARSRSRSPDRRRALRIGRGRSLSLSPRRAPRSCRSRSRTRSDECEDRRCCRPRQGDDDSEEDDEGYMSQDAEVCFVRIDRYDRLFKCAHCLDLLSSPVYECAGGHLTCAACHADLNDGEDREPACDHCGDWDYRRSRAAADWLRSIRFGCENYKYGCPAYRARYEIDAHERACRYAPCFCPVRRCDFPGGPTDQLGYHLTEDHGWSLVDFRYGEPFTVRVHSTPSVLRARDDGEIFHLGASYKRKRRATALSMVCIRPDNAAEAEFTYQVRTPPVEGVPQRLQMQATVWATSLARKDNDQVCVTAPDGMFPREGPEADSVEVRVDRIVPAPAGNN